MNANTIVPMRFSNCPLLWEVEDIASPELRQRLINFIESCNPALVTSNPAFRDQDRVIKDDPVIASLLFTRLQPSLPPAIGDLRLQGLNQRLRLYRYRPGQRFTPHMDHWYQPSLTTITLLTVLVYLNDDFQGGEIRFMEQLNKTVTPIAGAAAIFQHKIRHEGCEVVQGIKYALRTDAIYAAPSRITLTYD